MGEGLESVGNGGKAPRGRRRRWVGAGLAVVVVAIAVFAVAQGGGSGGGPLNAIAKAAEVTQREPGGRAVLHATITSTITPEGITESGSMIFDETGRTRGVLTVVGNTTGKEVTVQAVSDGTTAYMRSDQFDSLPGGKKWMELDLSAATKEAGSVPAAGSPKEGLRILERVQGATAVGKEDIEGVPTTHYKGTLPDSGEAFGVKVHTSGLQVDVWIDAQDRVRRMQLAVTGSVGEAATSSTTEMTIDYVSFGRVPKIGLPDPGEVFNVTSEVESNIQEAAEGN
jgi:hypothetical protein